MYLLQKNQLYTFKKYKKTSWLIVNGVLDIESIINTKQSLYDYTDYNVIIIYL